MSAADQIQRELDRVGRELSRGSLVYWIQREMVGKAAGLRFALLALEKELPFNIRKDGELELNIESYKKGK